MLKFILRPKSGPNGELILRIGPLMRILFALMTTALLAGMLTGGDGPAPILGIILTGLAALGMFYEEKWVFDKENRILEARTGLVFLFKRDRLAFDKIRAFILYSTPKPAAGDADRGPSARRSRYVLFALELDDGRQKNIELVKTRDAEELKAKARQVAAYCGKPLHEE